MNIENLREMTWKEKRNLAETTNDMQLLIELAGDSSAHVRKEVLQREDAPIEAITNVYSKASTSQERKNVIHALYRARPTDTLRNLLSQMVLDADDFISIEAIRMYRNKFKTIGLTAENCWRLETETDPTYLDNWAIMLPGFDEQSQLADNPNITGELAHKFVMALFCCERSLYSIQKCLYKVLSHPGILDRTIQYIRDRESSRNYADEFYMNPKYALSSCTTCSSDQLNELMNEYQSDVNKYVKEDWLLSVLVEFFDKFFSSLICNPNCTKETFDKAFNLFIKKFRLEWTNTLRMISECSHLADEQLLYMLQSHPGKCLMFSFIPERVANLSENDLSAIIANISVSSKNWIMQFAKNIPESLAIRLAV